MRMDGCRESSCASSPPSLHCYFSSLPSSSSSSFHCLGPLSARFSRFFPLTSFSRHYPIKLFFFSVLYFSVPPFFLFRSASIYGCILSLVSRGSLSRDRIINKVWSGVLLPHIATHTHTHTLLNSPRSSIRGRGERRLRVPQRTCSLCTDWDYKKAQIYFLFCFGGQQINSVL